MCTISVRKFCAILPLDFSVNVCYNISTVKERTEQSSGKVKIMKYIINANYGGYGVEQEVMDKLGLTEEQAYDRQNPELIKYIEEGNDVNEGDLVVVEIPDEATDFEVDEYDGYESIIAVVDGKIVHIS